METDTSALPEYTPARRPDELLDGDDRRDGEMDAAEVRERARTVESVAECPVRDRIQTAERAGLLGPRKDVMPI